MHIIDARMRLPQANRPEQITKVSPLHYQQYNHLLDLERKLAEGTDAALLESLKVNNVAKAVIHAEVEVSSPASAINSAVMHYVSRHKEALAGIGTVTMPIGRPGTAVKEVIEAAQMGLVGLNIQPSFFGVDISDRSLYPLYSRAEELGLVINLHTGVNYSRISPMRHERAELLDQVACDFPDLHLVACHSGWPQVAEFCAVARRHPTVHLELGGLAPKYIGRTGSGWEVLHTMMPRLLRDQILFATDWPVMDHGRVLQEWLDLDLPEAALTAILGGNAERLYWSSTSGAGKDQ